MNNIKNTITRDFSIVPNALINDRSISPQARFLFVYAASKPDDWDFINSDLEKALGCHGDTLRKWVAELENAGWIERRRKRNSEGRFSFWDWVLRSQPVRKISESVKNQFGKSPTINNTDLGTKKDIVSPPQGEAEILELSIKIIDNELDKDQTVRTIKERARLIPEVSVDDIKAQSVLWLSHYAGSTSSRIIQDPIKAIFSGRGNFVGWLARDRDKMNTKAKPKPKYSKADPNPGSGFVYDDKL